MRTVENPDEFRENIRKHLSTLINDDKISSNLEKGVLNYSINVSNNKNIVKKWDNGYFVIIYTERLGQ